MWIVFFSAAGMASTFTPKLDSIVHLTDFNKCLYFKFYAIQHKKKAHNHSFGLFRYCYILVLDDFSCKSSLFLSCSS